MSCFSTMRQYAVWTWPLLVIVTFILRLVHLYTAVKESSPKIDIAISTLFIIA